MKISDICKSQQDGTDGEKPKFIGGDESSVSVTSMVIIFIKVLLCLK